MSKLEELGGLEALKQMIDSHTAGYEIASLGGHPSVEWFKALIEHIETLAAERDALKKRVEELEHSWRCFRCGEVFTDRDKAAEHFNGDYCEDEEPWCQFVSRMEAAEKRVEELERAMLCDSCKSNLTSENLAMLCAKCLKVHTDMAIESALKTKLQAARELAVSITIDDEYFRKYFKVRNWNELSDKARDFLKMLEG